MMRKMAIDIGSVFVGGVLGSAARAGVAEVAAIVPALLFVNLSGSFALGALVGWRLRSGRPGNMAVNLIGIGFIGSFTTFSAFAMAIIESTPLGGSILAVASVGLGLVLTRLGLLAGGRL